MTRIDNHRGNAQREELFLVVSLVLRLTSFSFSAFVTIGVSGGRFDFMVAAVPAQILCFTFYVRFGVQFA